MPGLFPDRVTDVPTLVRAATGKMYGGMFGDAEIVPRLDYVEQTDGTIQALGWKNPILAGPIFQTAFRTGAMPVKFFSLGAPDPDTGRRQRKEASDHPAYQLWLEPNPDLTPNLLISGTVAGMYIYKRIAWWKERPNQNKPPGPGNEPVALWPIPGPWLKVLSSPNRIIGGYELAVPGESPKRLRYEDVMLFRFMPDPQSWYASVSPAEAIIRAAGWTDAATHAMTKLFRRSLLQRLWIDLQGQELDDDARDRLRTEVEIAMNTPDGVPVMESNALLKSITQGPADDLLRQAVDSAEKLARRVLGMPENVDDLPLFYAEVIQPITDAIEWELKRTLMTEWPQQKAFPQFQGFEIVEGTPAQRAERRRTQILSGQLTPNEARSEDDRPPVEGGDEIFVPLNVVVAKDLVNGGGDRTDLPNAKPPRSGSAGGFGGQEGRTTGGASITKLTPRQQQAARMADLGADPLLRAKAQKNWLTVRDRVLNSRSTSVERRLRGAVKAEMKKLRSWVAPDGKQPAKDATVGAIVDPNRQTTLEATDEEIAQLLDETMRRTAQEAYVNAATILKTDIELTDQLPFAVDVMLQARVRSIVNALHDRRQQAFNEMAGIMNAREWDQTLKEKWEDVANHLVNVIGKTETAWAFERGAAMAWHDLGYTELAVAGEQDGTCRTGVCDQAVEQTFGAYDVPTPLHPGCEHFAVPAGMVG
jgi:hypothetical protein